jgi:hypothetical protein
MTTYLYRDELTRRELLPALAAGAGVGLVAAYFVQLMLRKRVLPSGAEPPALPPAPRFLPRGER